MKIRASLPAAVLGLLPALAGAQPSWQAIAPPETRLELFTALRTANYPTAETLYRGDFHYEISHRFLPTIDQGYEAGFGFDGPANIRTTVSYGLHDRLMMTLGRSSLQDNLDLQLRYRWLQFRHMRFPSVVALNAGAAWNTDIPAIVDRGAAAAENFQYYGQMIFNTMMDDKLGVGLVPSFLYNSAIFSVDPAIHRNPGNLRSLLHQPHLGDLGGVQPGPGGVPGHPVAGRERALAQLAGLGPLHRHGRAHLLRVRHQQHAFKSVPIPRGGALRRGPGQLARRFRDHAVPVGREGRKRSRTPPCQALLTVWPGGRGAAPARRVWGGTAGIHVPRPTDGSLRARRASSGRTRICSRGDAPRPC